MNFAHSEVATLDPNTMRTLCEEYVANNYIDPETSERLGVKRGLRNPDGTGVLAGLTNVCDVVGYQKGSGRPCDPHSRQADLPRCEHQRDRGRGLPQRPLCV